MANNIHELAQEAFDSGNYQLALEMFEHILRFSDNLNNSSEYALSIKSLISIDTYIGYGDSLARCGRIRESFNVFAFICNKLGYSLPLHRLKHLTIGLLESVTSPVPLKTFQQQLNETQLPLKHLLQKNQQQDRERSALAQPLDTSDLVLSDNSSECARSVLQEFSMQKPRHGHDDSNQGDKLNGCTMNNAKQIENSTNSHERGKCLNETIDQMGSYTNLAVLAEVDADPKNNGQRRRNSSECNINECSVLNRCSRTMCNAVDLDPLLCPICSRVFLYPVTMSCGHTFCRECIHDETQCHVCDKRFLFYGGDFKQDVLISRLVEKWWMTQIQAELVNDKTQTLIRQNALDEALKSSNESLEKCSKNYKGLLLRSEVLYRLGHFQSSLADAEKAIKCRPTTFNAYLYRALSLAALGSIDDAIVSYCLSVHFNRTLSALSKSNRSEVTKLIHKFLMNCKLSTKSSAVRSDEPFVVKKYLNRCHLRTLKHFPQLYNERCFQSAPFDYEEDDCLSDFNGTANAVLDGIQSQRLSQKFRHYERENYCYPYPKSLKLLKASKKFRRKHFDVENDANLQGIVYLNRLTDNINDSAASHSTMDKRISKLLDEIQYAIYKAKQGQSSGLIEVQPSLVDISDFDCVLCYRTLWKPVVTPCGHTYCMVCLDRCLDYSSCCPLCKTSLVEDHNVGSSNTSIRNTTATSGTNCSLASYASSKKAVTRFIEVAMQRFIPLAYRKRQLLEIEKEPSVPVFICTTAYPNVPCPLYVYEPRHRLMIRRAIESGQRQFGIVQPQANGGYSDFGTILNIQDCVLLGNGCSILSTIGYKRFRVIERNEKDGYDTAKVEYICDEAISEDRLSVVKLINETIYKKAINWYNSLPTHIHSEIHKSFGSMPMLQRNLESIADGPSWAWYIIALLPLNQNLKVEILATTDLEKRLRAIDKTLEYVAAQQRRSVCVLSCEGLQTCQAVDCCIRASSSSQLDDSLQSNATQNHVTNFLL